MTSPTAQWLQRPSDFPRLRRCGPRTPRLGRPNCRHAEQAAPKHQLAGKHAAGRRHHRHHQTRLHMIAHSFGPSRVLGSGAPINETGRPYFGPSFSCTFRANRSVRRQIRRTLTRMPSMSKPCSRCRGPRCCPDRRTRWCRSGWDRRRSTLAAVDRREPSLLDRSERADIVGHDVGDPGRLERAEQLGDVEGHLRRMQQELRPDVEHVDPVDHRARPSASGPRWPRLARGRLRYRGCHAWHRRAEPCPTTF